MTSGPLRLTERTILVTGGGSGIGRGLAEALHSLGNHVVIAGRRATLLDEVVAANPGMHALPLDIGDPVAVTRAAQQLIAEHPALDTIVHAAGVGYHDDLSEPLDDALLRATFDINLLGPIRLTSALIEHLKSRPDGALIYVTSMLAYLPYAETALYSASKAALHAVVLAQRYRLRDSRVRVIEIAPPLVATAFAGNDQDPRAMPLGAFLTQTMAALEAGGDEALVAGARTRRDTLRSGEVAAMTAFNERMAGGLTMARDAERASLPCTRHPSRVAPRGYAPITRG